MIESGFPNDNLAPHRSDLAQRATRLATLSWLAPRMALAGQGGDFMADVGEAPMLLAKKFGGLVLIVLGLLGLAFGYQYGSGALTAGGVVALVVGAGLLMLKIIRRNPD